MINKQDDDLQDIFVLLDEQSPTQTRARYYENPIAYLPIQDLAQLQQFSDGINDYLNKNQHIVIFADYEFNAVLDPSISSGVTNTTPKTHKTPPRMMHVYLFEKVEILGSEKDVVDKIQWLKKKLNPKDSYGALIHFQESLTEKQFQTCLEQIHQYLLSGDTYQVNFTYRIGAQLLGSSLVVYETLRSVQPTYYGCYAHLQNVDILSFSPELFFEKENQQITMKPMKGTSSLAQQSHMATDTKTLAENVMIVDLLRNDLGRVAQKGTVKVPSLFDIQAVGNSSLGLAQMTSTVTATIRQNIDFMDFLKSVFPCGSITGAPKVRTMEIIHQLESEPRGIYTGMIGYLEPFLPQNSDDRTEISNVSTAWEGRACFSVPIRTVSIKPNGEAMFGVGAGIVYDSNIQEEWQECHLKSRFLTQANYGLGLIESMLLLVNTSISHLAGWSHLGIEPLDHVHIPLFKSHLERLRQSSVRCGLILDEKALNFEINQQINKLENGAYRLRLLLTREGFELKILPLTPLMSENNHLNICFAKDVLPSDQKSQILRQHKLAWREHYDQAVSRANTHHCFDVVYGDDQGRVLEGAISNVYVQLDQTWYTPPIEIGVLPGVMRSYLMAHPKWCVKERVLTQQDLKNASQIAVSNGVRGVWLAKLLDITI